MMERFLGKYAPYLYAILRIIAGLMFAMHGTQKLFGWPVPGPPPPIPPMIMAAGIFELVCGLLIAIGLLTGYAAFVASGEMAVAFFMAHSPRGLLPIVNQGELAVLYCFLFLYIAAQGPGPWSVDTIIREGKTGYDT
jgi:putative oxidoreductase